MLEALLCVTGNPRRTVWIGRLGLLGKELTRRVYEALIKMGDSSNSNVNLTNAIIEGLRTTFGGRRLASSRDY